MDDAITEMWGGESPSMLYPMVQLRGAYMCCVVEKHIPGQWFYNEEDGLSYTAEGEQEPAFNPFIWTRKRMRDGEGDSIASKYQTVKSLVAGEIDLS